MPTAPASNAPDPTYVINPRVEDIPDPSLRAIYESCTTYAHVINESLQIAKRSKNPSTKVSRLMVARQRLNDLKALIAQFPMIQLPNLGEVEQNIADLDKEFIEIGYYASLSAATNAAAPAGIVAGQIGQVSPAGVARAMGWEDVIAGFEFFATHQLRTPLRILLRNGEVHRDMHTTPPVIATEQWQGIWLIRTKRWRELGSVVDMPEFQPSTVASDAGQVRSEEYLPFLIAVRSIVEREGTATSRSSQLRDELERPCWAHACKKLGGWRAIVDHFFPPFIDSLPREAASFLRGKGVKTPAAVARVTDGDILAIKGIGPAKLLQIRTACSEAANPDEELLDFVYR